VTVILRAYGAVQWRRNCYLISSQMLCYFSVLSVVRFLGSVPNWWWDCASKRDHFQTDKGNVSIWKNIDQKSIFPLARHTEWKRAVELGRMVHSTPKTSCCEQTCKDIFEKGAVVLYVCGIMTKSCCRHFIMTSTSCEKRVYYVSFNVWKSQIMIITIWLARWLRWHWLSPSLSSTLKFHSYC